MEAPKENSLDEFFDEGIKSADAMLRLVEKQASPLHRLFVQNEEGAALLKAWKEKLIMIPTVTPNSTQFEAGIEEGFKSFIRMIVNQVEQFEQQTVENKNE